MLNVRAVKLLPLLQRVDLNTLYISVSESAVREVQLRIGCPKL